GFLALSRTRCQGRARRSAHPCSEDLMINISGEAIDTLKASVRGKDISPSDADYNEARTVWNATIDRRPALIVRCAGAADVMAALKFARGNGLLLSIRGGAHNIAGSAVSDDALMIDLSA